MHLYALSRLSVLCPLQSATHRLPLPLSPSYSVSSRAVLSPYPLPGSADTFVFLLVGIRLLYIPPLIRLYYRSLLYACPWTLIRCRTSD